MNRRLRMKRDRIRTGKIIMWRHNSGWGFIEKTDDEVLSFRDRQIFFHIHNFEGSSEPEEDMEVYFSIGKDSRGRDEAIHVRPIAEVSPEEEIDV
jgi:cold shock CspA family protein